MKIGDFLLRRPEEAGVRHLFGVPGDYNLALLQQLQDTGTLNWIGTCNELNASYAADGYARLNGLGALLVTNGVGALSAINGVAGSYSEHVPVICIAGSIPLRSIDRGLGMHHTMADGTWDHFLNAYAPVTAARARLNPRNAASEIDRLILTAWREKLPVYMEVPSDIAYLEIEVPTAPLNLAAPPSDPERLRSCMLRSQSDCPARSHRRSWWMRMRAVSVSLPSSWSWPKRCRPQSQRSTLPRA
jgi:indolepyruvate decarboxylase